MLEIGNRATERKDAFDRLIPRVDTDEEDSLGLRILQQKLPTLRRRRED